VSDEAIHKELGDRMERAATTASSLEAEQDSGSGPMCQDTILGDVDAQTWFETTSIQSNDPPLSKVNTFRSRKDTLKLMELMAQGIDCLPSATIFEELARMGAKSTAWNEFSSTMASLIICLLGDMSHHKKIFVNPSHTKNFFANMKREGKDFSGRITPLFDTMMVQASEEVGEDSDHPTDSNQMPIIDQPSTSSPPKKKQKSKRKQRKEVEVAHDETEHEESIPTPSNDPQPSAIEIASLKKRVDKLEMRRKFKTTGLKRLKKVGATRRIESSNDSLGAQEDASKQGRRIEDIDTDAEVTLVNETRERQDEDLMFDTRVLDDDEMFVDAITSEKDEQSIKIDDSTAGEAVTAAGVEDSTAPIIQVFTDNMRDEGVTAANIDELTLAQTLIEIKAAKPKVVITTATTTTTTRPKARGVVVQEPSEFRTSPEAQPSKSTDKGKSIMIEPERPLKRKDQVALDEDLATNIQA
ncbi:hypothetical protein Tco_1204685, partial [Tanacetum coccineum]